MLMPSIFGESLFDDFMNDFTHDFPFPRPMKSEPAAHLMRTDVKELEGGYEVEIELPGVRKEDVKAELKDGYMTISATHNTKKDEKDENGTYIRRERYSGVATRSFYVGEEVTEEDIKAKFENGVLKITIPKKEAKPAVEDKKYIAIEG